MIAPTATRQARRRYGGLSHRFLDSVDSPLLSRHHFTAPPSPKRYDNRYEVEGRTNFLELRTCELRRISLLGTSVNRSGCPLVFRGRFIKNSPRLFHRLVEGFYEDRVRTFPCPKQAHG